MLRFWESKSLTAMTNEEWESLCDRCGKCCLHKFIDDETEEVYYTNVACNLLNKNTCSCKDYQNRFESNEECLQLTRENIAECDWLPDTCSYRLLMKNKPLPKWHPLITGSQEAMHDAGMSVKDLVVYEIDVVDWEDHVINHPNR